MKKRRKKKWTTKNTHFKRMKKREDVEKTDIYLKIATILVIAAAILSILVIASNNHVVGYDHFIGIPYEWVRSLYDR